ncbi:MAG TPA: urease accessory protein UreD [Gemmataceae bacterium]|nr:urease accessory protein UreD [Gemmataceae bacterium]
MGPWPARITVDDFLTPPELRPFALAANAAGRVGGVRAELINADGQTRLGRCYQQVPLRVLPPFHFGPEEPALLYLLNPTAGLMDGDAHLVDLHAGPGTRAVVVGQSATRIHPAVHGFCTQRWRVRVEAGAVLVILPGPVIPFAGSRSFQKVEIDLAADASVIWGDLWLAGRYARGDASERFSFDLLVQEMTVRRAGRLVFRDRFCWRGPWDDATAAWHFGPHPATASLFVTGTLDAEACAGGALLSTVAGDSCIRWTGSGQEVAAAIVGSALIAAAFRTEAANPWLLNGFDLAPNHWFSFQRESRNA